VAACYEGPLGVQHSAALHPLPPDTFKRLSGGRARSSAPAFPQAHGDPPKTDAYQGENNGADICAPTTGASLLQEVRDGEQSNRVEHEEATHCSQDNR